MPRNESSELGDLRLRVAPLLVEDLGINLYTTLARVLVEYVANAHDADATRVEVSIPLDRIEAHRQTLIDQWKEKKRLAKLQGVKLTRSEALALPESVSIRIADNGCGMSLAEMRDFFLVAGRRRRGRDNSHFRTAGGRLLMGRKGWGKLAGFGAAQSVVVTSRKSDSEKSLRIELHYSEIAKAEDGVDSISAHPRFVDQIPLEGYANGTAIELTGLLLDPSSVEIAEVRESIGQHFINVDESELAILINGEQVSRGSRNYVWAWPKPEIAPEELVSQVYDVDGESHVFEYRLRFVEDKKALQASERGVRIFAHRQLAAEASLLKADTNMHGFRMTDYLDGVVYADFIDEQPEDYTATDRQSLRWETPLLSPMREFLGAEIKKACAERQALRDKSAEGQARKHDGTKQFIEDAGLTKGEKTLAFQFAGLILSNTKKGLDEPAYLNRVEQVVKGLGRGKLLATLADLATQEEPEFKDVLASMARLTAEQLDSFYRFVRGRVDGLRALSKIVDSVSDGPPILENQLQQLFSQNPWLLDPRYFEYVTSDRSNATLFQQMEEHLETFDTSHIENEFWFAASASLRTLLIDLTILGSLCSGLSTISLIMENLEDSPSKGVT